MSVQITTGFFEEYKSTVQLLSQQMGSRFAMACTIDTYRGEGGRAVNQVGVVDAQTKTTRHADVVYNETPHDARWVYPTRKFYADLIDSDDRLRTIAQFDSAYAKAGASALERGKDDLIIAAFFADAKTGQSGSTTTSFDSTNQEVAETVGAAAATGMNVAKLREARKILRANEVDLDMEPIFCAITAEQEAELLNEYEVKMSGQTGVSPVMEDGKLKKFLGFNFIHSERLATDDDSYRRCPVWVPSGMHLGMWEDIFVSIDRIPTKHNSTQIYVGGDFGATRTEEKKVVEIKCSEA